MSINWRLPWRSVYKMLPEDMPPTEAIHEWALWHDEEDWTQDFMDFVRRWDIDLGDLAEYASHHSRVRAEGEAQSLKNKKRAHR